MNMTPEDEKLYNEAQKKVKRLKGFYSNMASYFAVGIFLTVVNWFTSPGYWWVKWVWLGWAIGLFFQAVGLYKKNILFGDNWEERKIKEEMEKMKRQ